MSCNNINKKSILKQFTQGFFDFLDFIKENADTKNDVFFKEFYYKCMFLKKTNIKLLIKTWHENITKLYYSKIMTNDISYFLNKDYSNDVSKTGTMKNTMNQYINIMKQMYLTINDTIKNKIIGYIQLLTQSSQLYYI